jgi:hypothetical protein
MRNSITCAMNYNYRTFVTHIYPRNMVWFRYIIVNTTHNMHSTECGGNHQWFKRSAKEKRSVTRENTMIIIIIISKSLSTSVQKLNINLVGIYVYKPALLNTHVIV